MVDDLVNKSTDEPYRMFTSRAEHRLLLRQDNADMRLMEHGKKLGLQSPDMYGRFERKRRLVNDGIKLSEAFSLRPGDVNSHLESLGADKITENEKLSKILKRPEVSLAGLLELESVRTSTFGASLLGEDDRLYREAVEQIEIELKYNGYIVRQREQVAKFENYESKRIPEDTDFSGIRSLSMEGKEKLSKVRPSSIGQASRISGVTPSDISVLMVYLKK
jgi:tRNA uridine 5-carboxymethylaminomethyl modification enzyme